MTRARWSRRPGRTGDRLSFLHDRLRRCGAATVIVLLATLCACQSYDPGGSVRERMVAARAAHETGAQVEVRGACYSACALKLASGRGLCVSRNAVIGVHEVREATPRDYADGARDDASTRFFEMMLPRCAESLFASRHGFDSGDLVMFSGQEVLSACPQFATCTG